MAVGDEISGKDGKFNYGASPTELYITKHSSKRSSGTKEVTSSKDASAGWRRHIPDGWFGIEGTFEGFVLAGGDPPTEGSSVAIELVSDSARKWAGNGIITEISEDLEVSGSEAISFSGTFIGTGAWTRTDTTV